MAKTWTDWCRKNNLSQDTIPFEHEDWFSWIDYGVSHYHDPIPTAKENDWSD